MVFTCFTPVDKVIEIKDQQHTHELTTDSTVFFLDELVPRVASC